jgi:hypothetical protein
LALGLIGISFYVRYKEKSLSPERKAKFEGAGFSVYVQYSAPYKKGRKIFGGLVPYGELWRTGANEATVFATDNPITIQGQKIPNGRYHLVTIPHPDHWTVILNSDIPGWGIDIESGVIYHNPKEDVLVVDVPVQSLPSVAEQFNISFEKMASGVYLIFRWDDVLVAVPITKSAQE